MRAAILIGVLAACLFGVATLTLQRQASEYQTGASDQGAAEAPSATLTARRPDATPTRWTTPL